MGGGTITRTTVRSPGCDVTHLSGRCASRREVGTAASRVGDGRGGAVKEGDATEGDATEGDVTAGDATRARTTRALGPSVPIVLAAVAGFVDAVGFSRVFGVFPANQSGNVIFLGMALGGSAGVPRSLALGTGDRQLRRWHRAGVDRRSAGRRPPSPCGPARASNSCSCRLGDHRRADHHRSCDGRSAVGAAAGAGRRGHGRADRRDQQAGRRRDVDDLSNRGADAHRAGRRRTGGSRGSGPAAARGIG